MLDLLEKAIIRRLSEDLPLDSEPYKIIAEELGTSEEILLKKIKELHDKQIVRRVSGILYHRKSGYNANAMVVWIVPEDKVDNVGKTLSYFKEITHCYERPTFQDWPYNLFTMIHSETKEECENIIKKISEVINIKDYKVLYSTKELKKSSIKYFNISK